MSFSDALKVLASLREKAPQIKRLEEDGDLLQQSKDECEAKASRIDELDKKLKLSQTDREMARKAEDDIRSLKQQLSDKEATISALCAIVAKDSDSPGLIEKIGKRAFGTQLKSFPETEIVTLTEGNLAENLSYDLQGLNAFTQGVSERRFRVEEKGWRAGELTIIKAIIRPIIEGKD